MAREDSQKARGGDVDGQMKDHARRAQDTTRARDDQHTHETGVQHVQTMVNAKRAGATFDFAWIRGSDWARLERQIRKQSRSRRRLEWKSGYCSNVGNACRDDGDNEASPCYQRANAALTPVTRLAGVLAPLTGLDQTGWPNRVVQVHVSRSTTDGAGRLRWCQNSACEKETAIAPIGSAPRHARTAKADGLQK